MSVYKVSYEDGSTEDVKIRLNGRILLERKIKAAEKAGDPEIGFNEAIVLMLWGSKGSPGEFDEWVATVDDVTDAEDTSSDPSKPTATEE